MLKKAEGYLHQLSQHSLEWANPTLTVILSIKNKEGKMIDGRKRDRKREVVLRGGGYARAVNRRDMDGCKGLNGVEEATVRVVGLRSGEGRWKATKGEGGKE